MVFILNEMFKNIYYIIYIYIYICICLYEKCLNPWLPYVTPRSRGSVNYPSTGGILVNVGRPDIFHENRAESLLYGELYPNTKPAYTFPKQSNITVYD